MIDKNDTPKKKDGFAKKLGDKLERAGEKISSGAPEVGRKLRDLGDKIEHSRDNKKGAV